MIFEVVTEERVQGRYLVQADDEDGARAVFERRQGRLVDFDRAAQIDYMAYEVDVESVTPRPDAKIVTPRVVRI